MLRANRTPPPPTDAELALQQAMELRRRHQIESLREPRFPSTGTEVVAAKLAAARARRDGGDRPIVDLR